ncbi:response regulator [bacterium]|nr:response regulator [bacterium]
MKPTLLLVEDHPEALEQLTRALDHDFDIVATATTGAEAVAMCEKHQPGLVLMDLVMPKMSGLDATRLILARVRPNPRIVILSGLDQEEVAVSAIEAGAHDYLVKPTSLETIREALLNVLKKAA